MSHPERGLRGTRASEHVVRLFDETESLIIGVTSHLVDGWKRGDNLLVVARPEHWALASAELEASGCPIADCLSRGTLIALDAATTLATFMVSGSPEPAKFRATVGDLVARLSLDPDTGVTIYGEMVDILAAQGNFSGAEQLEALWNDLGRLSSFRLLCGYSSAQFGDQRTDRHLHAICCAHTAAGARETDLLATWLLSNRRSTYHIERH